MSRAANKKRERKADREGDEQQPEEEEEEEKEKAEPPPENEEYWWRIQADKAPTSDWMSKQTEIDIKTRAIHIDWLMQVHAKFKLHPETLYLAVNLLDRFLQKRIVSRNRLLLVGSTAMFVACKYEETYSPEVADFVRVSGAAFKCADVLALEIILLNTLEFAITTPSALLFAHSFFNKLRVPEQTRMVAQFLMEVSLKHYELHSYLPAVMAASTLFMAICATDCGRGGDAAITTDKHATGPSSGTPPPPTSLRAYRSWRRWWRWWSSAKAQVHTRYSESELLPCIDAITAVVDHSAPIGVANKGCAARCKYASPAYSQASTKWFAFRARAPPGCSTNIVFF